MKSIERRQSEVIINNNFVHWLNKVGRQLSDSTPISDLLKFSENPTREIPPAFFELKGPEISEWYYFMRELSPKQRRVLKKSLASAARGNPKNYDEPPERILFTVGDIRNSSEVELNQILGISELGVQLIRGTFAKPIPGIDSADFSTN